MRQVLGGGGAQGGNRTLETGEQGAESDTRLKRI